MAVIDKGWKSSVLYDSASKVGVHGVHLRESRKPYQGSHASAENTMVVPKGSNHYGSLIMPFGIIFQSLICAIKSSMNSHNTVKYIFIFTGH